MKVIQEQCALEEAASQVHPLDANRRQRPPLMPVLGTLLFISAGMALNAVNNRSTESMPTEPAKLAASAARCNTLGQQIMHIDSPELQYGITAEAMYTEVMVAMREHSTCSAASLMANVALNNPQLWRADGTFSGGTYVFPLSATKVNPTANA